MNLRLQKTIVYLFSILFFATPAFAQIEPNISLSLSPELPGPNENVSIDLVTYSTDLDNATMIWTLNGSTALAGIGEKKFSFTTGNTGIQTKISVSIKTVEGGSLTKTITVTPSELNVIWEATDSYVPPFYKGKALPAQEANIKIFAIPTNISGGNLVYTWKRNSTIDGKMSGYGKQAFSFKNSFLKDREIISVEARSKNGDYSAKKDISIDFIEPKIIFYEKNPLSGVFYNKSVFDRISIGGDEKTIVAEPFFYSVKNSLSQILNYSWEINNAKISTPEVKNELTIRAQSRTGVAKIGLDIEADKKLFQKTDTSILIDLQQ